MANKQLMTVISANQYSATKAEGKLVFGGATIKTYTNSSNGKEYFICPVCGEKRLDLGRYQHKTICIPCILELKALEE